MARSIWWRNEGQFVVFVEVKARVSFADAVDAVGAQTRRRIERAGYAFIARHRGLADHGVRYDIIAVSGWRIRRFKDAWREGG